MDEIRRLERISIAIAEADFSLLFLSFLCKITNREFFSFLVWLDMVLICCLLLYMNHNPPCGRENSTVIRWRGFSHTYI